MEQEKEVKRRAIIERFIAGCKDPGFQDFRESIVKNQFNRKDFEYVSPQVHIRIAQSDPKFGGDCIIKWEPTSELNSMVQYAISRDEFHQLKRVFFGKYKPDIEYLRKLGVKEEDLRAEELFCMTLDEKIDQLSKELEEGNKTPEEEYNDIEDQNKRIEGYAFPGMQMGLIGEEERTIYTPGIEKRMYLALHAPPEPSWFVIKEPEKLHGLKPDWQSIADHFDKEECRKYTHGEIPALSEHLQWFEEKLDKWCRADEEFNYRVKMDRYFAWRELFADEMLKRFANKL